MATIDKKTTSEIVAEHGAKPELLVQILQTITSRFGWIPDATIRQLAEELNLSRADVHGVVEYYHDFRTEEPGKHILKICQAEACQAMGADDLAALARQHLGVDWHGTTRDGEVTLEPTFCLGLCSVAPAAQVGERLMARVAELEDEISALSGLTEEVERRLDGAIGEIRAALAR